MDSGLSRVLIVVMAPYSGGGNASSHVGPTPPVTPGENQLWWNTNTGRMYLYYDDGDTIQW